MTKYLGSGRIQKQYTFDTVRGVDMELIRRLRNQHLDVLRQRVRITPREQKNFFKALSKTTSRPSSFYSSLRGTEGNWLGYGAIVHINWQRMECEVSSLLVSESQSPVPSPEFMEQFQLLHIFLLQGAKRTGLRRVFAEIYATRSYLIPLLEDLGFEFVPERPAFYRKIRGKARGVVMAFEIR